MMPLDTTNVLDAARDRAPAIATLADAGGKLVYPDAGRPLNILMVEDEPTDAELIERALRKTGLNFHTRRVDTWPDFIDALGTFAPDLVLSDYRLPTFDGMDALVHVKKQHPGLPVVMVTGVLGESVAGSLLQSGALGFVEKGNLATLGPTIQRALSATAETLKVLILDDEPADAEMAERALHKAGLSIRALRVDTRAEFQTALATFAPDIALLDVALPDYDGREALAYLRRVHPDIPSIMVSGVVGDEAAIELVKAGAQDYVLKSNLIRLAPAVERAVSVEAVIRARKAAERAVQQSETKFRNLVETTSDLIWELDGQGNFTYLSPRIKSLLGYEPSELLGTPVQGLIAEQDRERVGAYLDDIINAGKPFSATDALCRHRDGTVVAVEVSGVSVLDADGKLTGFRGITHDVTERRRADAKLREEEAKFRTIVEQNIAGIAIVKGDLSVGYINPYLAGLLGYPDADLSGRFFLDFVSDSFKSTVADHIRGHASGHRGFIKAEILLQSRDGASIDILVNAAPTTYQGEPASVGVLLDITERKKTERTLERTYRALRTLSAGNEAVARAGSEQELLDRMCRIIVESGGYRMAWIGARKTGVDDALEAVASAGIGAEYFEKSHQVSVRPDEKGCRLCGGVLATGSPQTSADLRSEPLLSPWHDELKERGFGSAAAFPLKAGNDTVAVLGIYAAETEAFGADEMRLLGDLAEDLSFGIAALRERQRSQMLDERWHSSLEAAIGAVANTMETRDLYTAGHQQRVAKLAAAIARDVGMSEDDVHGIYLAGIVHDIGKIVVPAEFLSKPGKLSDLEFALIKGHAEAGYNILKEVDFPWPIAEAVRQHHERLDGSGYPQGLTGDAISPQGKILAVADVVEAMMSHRPYRAALGIDAALTEVETNKGRLYDSAAVDACVALFRGKGFKFD